MKEAATEHSSIGESSIQSSDEMREFIKVQLAREERYLCELKGLCETIQQAVRPTLATPTEAGSLRYGAMPAPHAVFTREFFSLRQAPPPPIQSTDRQASADDYLQLKDSLLQKYDISAETYRQRFRAATLAEG